MTKTSVTGKQGQKHGFTLIELLISVVVITTCYVVVVQGLLRILELDHAAKITCEGVLYAEQYRCRVQHAFFLERGEEAFIKERSLSGYALKHEKSHELEYLENHVFSIFNKKEEKRGAVRFYVLPKETEQTIREEQK